MDKLLKMLGIAAPKPLPSVLDKRRPPSRQSWKKTGLQITRIARDQVFGGIRYFAEFYEKSKNVFLYTTSVQQWSEHNKLCYALGEELILAHEFFHYLECKSLRPAKEIYTVALFQIGRRRFGASSLRAVSEIGAHSFAYTYYTRRVNSLV